jgi:hypothetical protein
MFYLVSNENQESNTINNEKQLSLLGTLDQRLNEILLKKDF